MIENTFLFLPGIGPITERKIWQQGITNWNEFLEAKSVKGLSKNKKLVSDKHILRARRALLDENASYLGRILPLGEHWRLYNYFKDDAVFLDIETSGGYGYITVIGLYDGFQVKHLIRGANLYSGILKQELQKYKLMVTFNGSSFDIPVINRYFKNIVPNIPHVDLRHVCSKIGFIGGLKIIEKDMGIRRELDVQGVSGGDAVILWDKFRVTEEERYLDLLLKYNAEDVINLKPIADRSINELKTKVFG